MKKIRTLSRIMLPLILLFAVLASCGKGSAPAETTASTAATSVTTKATTAATTAATTTEPLPKTFDGYEFIIAGEKGGDGDTWYVGNPTTALQNQLFQAYREIEERLDIIITFDLSLNYDCAIANAVGGKTSGDFVCFRHQYWIPLAVKGYIQPLNTDKIKSCGLNVDDPEQVDLTMTQATKALDGENVWGVAFSGRYYSAPWGHALAFNKRLCENAGYPADTIYQMVRDHTWTWEKFEEICRAITDAENHIYGYRLLTNETVEITSDIPINYLGEDGRWHTNIGTQKFKNAAEWMFKLWNDREITEDYFDYAFSSGDPRSSFYAGNQGFSVLWCSDFGYMYGTCNTDMTDDYGYVPFPMGPNATEYSHVISDLYGFCLETANKDIETSTYILGEIAWALNAPDQYEIFARGYMRDDESVEMIMEYMLPNATFNTARLSSDTRNVVKNMIPEILSADSIDEVSDICDTFAANMQAKIDEIFN